MLPGIILFISAFPGVSCVVLAPPAGHGNTCSAFRALCRYSLISFLFFSWLLSVGPSPRHIIGLIVPANSNRVPSGLGLRPARMHEVFVSVSFPSSCFILFLFCPFWPFFALLRVAVLSSPPFRVYACTTDVPGAISQQVIRDRVVHVVIVPLPLRAGTAVHALFCFLRDVYCSLFCDHGLDFRNTSECENIVIINSSTLTPHAQMQRGKPAGHNSSALASGEEDGFDPFAAHACKSLVVRNTILLAFATPIRSRQAVSPM